ncbi:MAG: hypothetical protein JO060_03515 [Candidatus Eremiobacteraeota bacterium]|nr:hypothetical protein [Candidatus Eremiobacteraeota bacterium]
MENRERKKRERGALGVSILLHGLVAPLFVAMVIGVDDLRPDGHVSTSGLFSISIIHRAAPAPVRPNPAPHVVVREAAPVSRPSLSQHPHVVAAAQPHSLGTPKKTRRVAFVAPPPTPLPTPKRLTRTAPPPAVAPAAEQAAAPAAVSHVAVQSTPTASPTETPSPQPSAAVALVDAPVGGWGQNFRDPMVLDDDALAALRARYHGAVARVDVDEQGHATRVSVQGAGLDADALASLERRLYDLRYIPAECNGLRCAASLELKV